MFPITRFVLKAIAIGLLGLTLIGCEEKGRCPNHS